MSASVVRFVRLLVGQVTTLISSLLRRGAAFVESWLVDAKRARYGLAVTRILLALTGIGLLASNFGTRLYTFGSGSAWNGEAATPVSDFPQIAIFSLFHRFALHDTAFTIAYLALFVLAVLFLLGWRTKIILPIYFVGWVSFIEMNDAVGDQGDNMYRIVLMCLLFADTAGRWSLDARRRAATDRQTGPWLVRKWRGETILPAWLTNLSHNLVLVVVTCHVCFVYASGALYKAGGLAWQSGFAIYNPLHTARFGPWPEISDLLGTWAPIVTIVSWSSIMLQMSFPMMLLKRFTRVIALFGILSFHVGIAIMMGLPWFSLSMIAIDSIFIRDVTWRHVVQRVKTAWTTARQQATPEPETVQVLEPAPPADPARQPTKVPALVGRGLDVP